MSGQHSAAKPHHITASKGEGNGMRWAEGSCMCKMRSVPPPRGRFWMPALHNSGRCVGRRRLVFVSSRGGLSLPSRPCLKLPALQERMRPTALGHTWAQPGAIDLKRAVLALACTPPLGRDLASSPNPLFHELRYQGPQVTRERSRGSMYVMHGRAVQCAQRLDSGALGLVPDASCMSTSYCSYCRGLTLVALL